MEEAFIDSLNVTVTSVLGQAPVGATRRYCGNHARPGCSSVLLGAAAARDENEQQKCCQEYLFSVRVTHDHLLVFLSCS